jgi:hypothetical protein
MRLSWYAPPMVRSFVALLPALALFAGGCSVSSLLNKIEDESDKVVDLICECGIENINGMTCEETFTVSLFGGADRDCVEDALNVDKESSRENLECSLDVMKEYRKCIEDNLVCDDPASYSGCASIFEDFNACPQVSDEVNNAVGECFPDDGN